MNKEWVLSDEDRKIYEAILAFYYRSNKDDTCKTNKINYLPFGNNSDKDEDKSMFIAIELNKFMTNVYQQSVNPVQLSASAFDTTKIFINDADECNIIDSYSLSGMGNIFNNPNWISHPL